MARKASQWAAGIDLRQETYRRNAIHWLERCTARDFDDLDGDLAEIAVDFHPDLREVCILNLGRLLDDTVRSFWILR